MTVQSTSLNAYYNDILPKIGHKQAEVFNVIEHSRGLTNSEIAQILGYSINRITPRTNELVKQGLVCEGEKRPCGVTKRMAIAWVIVKKTLF